MLEDQFIDTFKYVEPGPINDSKNINKSSSFTWRFFYSKTTSIFVPSVIVVPALIEDVFTLP